MSTSSDGGPRAINFIYCTTNMSGSDCCAPKDGWHRREFYSLFIFFNPKYLFRGSLHAPREHHCWHIPVQNGVNFDAAFWVGYQLPILLKSILTASREQTHNNQFLLYFFEQLCSKNRVRFCWDTICVRESWYVRFWGFNPRPGTPLTR